MKASRWVRFWYGVPDVALTILALLLCGLVVLGIVACLAGEDPRIDAPSVPREPDAGTFLKIPKHQMMEGL